MCSFARFTAACVVFALSAGIVTAESPFLSVSVGGKAGMAVVGKIGNRNIGVISPYSALGLAPDIGILGVFGINLPLPGTFCYAPSFTMWIKSEEKAGLKHVLMQMVLNPIDLRYYFAPVDAKKVVPYAGIGFALSVFGAWWDEQSQNRPTEHHSYWRDRKEPAAVNAGANLIFGTTINVHEKVKPFAEIRAKLAAPVPITLSISAGATIALGGPSTAAPEEQPPTPQESGANDF